MAATNPIQPVEDFLKGIIKQGKETIGANNLKLIKL